MAPRVGHPKGARGKLLERIEESTGMAVVPKEHLDYLEESLVDYRLQTRELEDIGWSIMDYAGGAPQEMAQPARRKVVQRARFVWMNDPQAGAAVELMNDFVFGRGVPRPRCRDKVVQDVVDEAWDDPDNQEVLTSFGAQLALGTDLSLQSNVFLLLFAEGDDGKVKLSILRHDDVINAVPDPDMRHRVLWYVAVRRRQEWDFKANVFKPTDLRQSNQLKPTYYAHWQNVELAEEERGVAWRKQPDGSTAVLEGPDDSQIGVGRVYHIRINRHSEQIFGVPRFQRTLRWYTAYNDFVKSRLDMATAAAAIIMKRKLKATPSQLMKDAANLISRRGALGAAVTPDPSIQPGPMRASIIDENDSVDHEPLNLNSGSAQAQQDAQMIRAPLSAAERWTQAYFGDASNSSLATATSLELPILKMVENRQEVFQDVFRWFIDRVIERAVDSGRIPKQKQPGEDSDEDEPHDTSTPDLEHALTEAWYAEEAKGHTFVEAREVRTDRGHRIVVMLTQDEQRQTHFTLVEAHDGKAQDEESTERDLSYEFSMPSPLRRMMGDLITAVTSLAQTFDPNNTNPELSRVLLTIALGEGLEVENPSDVVDAVIPKGYIDPMVKAQLQAATAGAMAPGGPQGNGPPMSPEDAALTTPPGADGAGFYGAPTSARQPEDLRSGPYNAMESLLDELDAGIGELDRARPAPAPQIVERTTVVHAPPVTVNVPEQRVVVESKPPDVYVDVAAPPAPDVRVDVAAPPAPDVRVDVAAPAAAEPVTVIVEHEPAPRQPAEIEYDAQGRPLRAGDMEIVYGHDGRPVRVEPRYRGEGSE